MTESPRGQAIPVATAVLRTIGRGLWRATKTTLSIAGLLGVLGGLWVTRASAQSIICCSQSIDVQGSWVGTSRVANARAGPHRHRSSRSREVATAEVEQDRVVRATARYGLDSVLTELTVKRTPRPDLRPTIEHPNTRQLFVRVLNVGDGDAAASTLKVESFKYGTLLMDSRTFAIGSLAPGASSGMVLATESGSGITKWKVYADDLDVVKESDEENDTAELGY